MPMTDQELHDLVNTGRPMLLTIAGHGGLACQGCGENIPGGSYYRQRTENSEIVRVCGTCYWKVRNAQIRKVAGQ